MAASKISLARVFALLILVAGFQSVWADVWKGNIEAPGKQTIGGKEYYVIEKAAHLAWFSDSVNKYAIDAKWQKLISLIEADTSKAEYKTRAFKDSAISLMTAIRQDPESYYRDPAKNALWNKAPYTGYLRTAWNTEVNIPMNATITAEYLDMNNIPFTPIAAGNGTARFTGTFLGNGITIKNLKVDSKEFAMQVFDVVHGYPSYCQNVGLFGVIGSGTVRNLILDGVTIYATGKNDYWANPHQVSVGPVVGWMTGGTIDTCYTSGSIVTNGRDVGAGGIMGAMTNGKKISNALSTVSIEASGRDVYVGGISGVIRGSVTISSSVYDGDNLEAHPDEIGAQGAITGRIVNNRDTTRHEIVTITLENCYYDMDALENDIWVGSRDVYVDVVGDPKGFSNVNTEENACLLNKHTWNESTKTCSDSTGLWTNQENIAITGVSKREGDLNAETVFLITFDANGGSFAPGAKTTKELKFNTPLTADEISTPTYDSTKAFVGWSLDPTATASGDLGIVYGVKKVYAVWKNLNLYKITFDLNTGDSSATFTKMVVQDKAITTDGFAEGDLPTVYMVGDVKYYFAGWSLSKVGGQVVDTLGVATKDITFYARWNLAPQYKVIFNVQGHGTAPADKLVSEGEHTTAPDEPTAIGYVFEGWYTEPACKNKYNFQTLVDTTITLYANWTAIPYSITYNLNGGLNNVANPSTYTIEEEFSLEAPTINNDTLEFKGWFYDGSFTNQAKQITKGSYGDITLYANWKIKEFVINYQAGEEGVNNVPPVVKKYGEPITLLGAVYQRPGYEQDGWSTVDNGEKVYDLNGLYTDNKPVQLFPHWNKVTYTITYVLNGGEDATGNPKTYTLDDSTGFDLNKPTRLGYEFKGWFGAEDFSGSEIKKFQAKTPYGHKTLYAKWQVKPVTVTVVGQSCDYNGKSCGAKVTSISNIPSGYKGYVITDSIKNVKDGPIAAKVVGFAILNTTTGDTVTSAFEVVYNESDSVGVNPKVVNFTTANIPSETYTGDSIHVKGGSKTNDLVPGHTHNVGYTVDALEWREGGYDPVMTKKEDVVILDADGNDVTKNYSIGDITPPAKKFEVKKSDGDFNVVFASEHITDDGHSHSMSRGAESDVPGTTYRYRMDGGEWTTDLSSLTASGVGDHVIEVEATNPNYTKTQKRTATLSITDKIVVTVKVKGGTKEYDGLPLTGSYKVEGDFETGDVPTVELSGTITDVGSAIARVSSFKVMNGSSNVSSKYVFNSYDAFLTVTKAKLTIKTESASKTYDGTPLVKDVPIVTGLKNGEKPTIEVTGSQKMVGSSTNEYKITWGSVNPKNYQIVEDLGTLKVTKAEATIKVKDVVKLYGDADPALIGDVSGLADGAEGDLGELRYYRLNPSVKNAGENVDSIAVSYTLNPNYDVTVVLGKLTIKKRHVTLTSASATKVYDGSPLTNDTVKVGGDGFAPDEGFIFTVNGTQTNAGSSKNAFTYVLKASTDTAANYIIDAPVIGTLEVTKSPVKVTVKGNTNTYAYNGWEQVISGYSLRIDNNLYSVNDIEFSGDSVIRKTRSGNYPMGLEAKNFTNKNPNFDVTFDVTDGRLVILSPEIVVKYNDAGDTIRVIVGEKDSDSEVNDKINAALENHVPPISLPTKAADDDSTYAFAGWAKNLGSGMYEPVFDATVKLDTVQVVYQKNPKETIGVVIHVTDTYSEIVQRIDSTLKDNGIDLPTKPSDGDSNYVLVWVKDDSTGEYKPEFKGELIVEEIVVQYGDNPTDTIHVKIRPKDTHTQITDKIGSALTNHLPPIKVTPKDTSYSLIGWKQDSKTGNYVPIFSKDELVFKINFHLPDGAELVEEFEGYVYGKVTKLPDAVMTSDTTWVFKGWYTKTKGRGNHVKAMREGDYGNKSLYPYFIKTLRYDTYGEKEVNANGQKGEIVVIYTDRADTTIERALRSVMPKDFSKNGVKYTFNGWKLNEDVYTATFKRVTVRFNVVLDSRAFSIEEAQMGARYAVFDMDGRVVRRGVVSNGSQRVEVPKSGSYTVRVGKDALQVNVR